MKPGALWSFDLPQNSTTRSSPTDNRRHTRKVPSGMHREHGSAQWGADFANGVVGAQDDIVLLMDNA